MRQMKFFSYTNNNCNYTKAVSLENIRSLHRCQGEGKSSLRFYIRIEYMDGYNERFDFLEVDEVVEVYGKILKLLIQ